MKRAGIFLFALLLVVAGLTGCPSGKDADSGEPAALPSPEKLKAEEEATKKETPEEDLEKYFFDVATQDPKVLKSEDMHIVESLEIHGFSAIEALKAVAASETLNSLVKLEIVQTYVGNEGAKIIAEAQPLANLKYLYIIQGDIMNEGGVALADSEILSNVEKLNLRDNDIGHDGAMKLAKSETLKNLKMLNLKGNWIVPNTLPTETLDALAETGVEVYY